MEGRYVDLQMSMCSSQRRSRRPSPEEPPQGFFGSNTSRSYATFLAGCPSQTRRNLQNTICRTLPACGMIRIMKLRRLWYGAISPNASRRLAEPATCTRNRMTDCRSPQLQLVSLKRFAPDMQEQMTRPPTKRPRKARFRQLMQVTDKSLMLTLQGTPRRVPERSNRS